MDAIQTEKVYVAVGNDAQDGFKALNWALKKWNSHLISVVILHVTHNTPMDYVYTPCKLGLCTGFNFILCTEILLGLAWF